MLPLLKLTIRMPAVDADLWTDPVGLVDHIGSRAPAPAERALRSRLAGLGGYGFCSCHSVLLGLGLYLACILTGLPLT